jgi:hypothetical protein
MSRWRSSLVFGAGLVIAAASGLSAQSGCGDQCTAALQQCKRDCAGAEAFETCMGNCQKFYQACVAACE